MKNGMNNLSHDYETTYTNNQGGIVKKLLFPSFTDAGSNDTFRPKSSSEASSDSLQDYTDENNDEIDNNHSSEGHSMSPGDALPTRVSQHLLPERHKVEYDGSQVGGYAPSFGDLNESIVTFTGASTSPIEVKVEDVGGKDDILASPPKMTRRVNNLDGDSSGGDGGVEGLGSVVSRSEDGIECSPQRGSEVTSSVVGYHFLDTSLESGTTRDNLKKESIHIDGVINAVTELNHESQTISNDLDKKRQPMTLAEALARDNSIEKEKDDDTASEGGNSLVSEYGSEPGDYKVRLEDVHAMDALVEEGEEEEEEESSNQGGDGPIAIEGEALVKEDEEHLHQPLEDDGYDKTNVGDDDDAGRETPISTANLSSLNDTRTQFHSDKKVQDNTFTQHDESKTKSLPIKEETKTAVEIKAKSPIDESAERDILRERESNSPLWTTPAMLPVQSPKVSPDKYHDGGTTSTTPIAAVSAAIRRIGNGVSNMATSSSSCSRKSPGTKAKILDLDVDASAVGSISLENTSPRKVALSPRFSKSCGDDSNPQFIPQLKSPQHPNRILKNSNLATNYVTSSPLRHVTGCLSFDPGNGKKPYGNMTMNHSPPSSPLLNSSPKQKQNWKRMVSKAQSWDVESGHTAGGGNSRVGKGVSGNSTQPHPSISNRLGTSSHHVNFSGNVCGDNPNVGPRGSVKVSTQQSPGARFFSGLSAASAGTAFRNGSGPVLMRGIGQQQRPHQQYQQQQRSSQQYNYSTSNGQHPQHYFQYQPPLQPMDSPGRRDRFSHPKNPSSCLSSPVVRSSNSILLQSPQRVDIEREDALDILACLVERSVAFHEKTDEFSATSVSNRTLLEDDAKNNRTLNREHVSKERSPQNADDEFCEPPPPPDCSPSTDTSTPVVTPDSKSKLDSIQSSVSEIHDCVEALRKISREYDEQNSNNTLSHSTRSKALDELMRSHTYALEMNRAALSASTWLRAIGRSNKNMGEASPIISPSCQYNKADLKRNSGDTLNFTYSQSPSIFDSNHARSAERDPNNNSVTSVDSGAHMDAVSLRALLRSAEVKLAEKDEVAQRLDQELSICRAEIGRMKSAARAEAVFTSPDKSILDEEDDYSSSGESSDSGSDEFPELETALGDITPVLETTLGTTPGNARLDEFEVSQNMSEALANAADAKKEVLLLKAQLEEAKRQIICLTKGKGNEDVDNAIKKKDTSSVQSNEEEQITEKKEIEKKDTVIEKDAREENNEMVGTGDYNISDPIALSNPVLEKTLEEYMNAIRKSDKAEIEVLKQKLKELNESNETDEKSDEKMINVRMLDAENFITEWDKLGPLPPPPDHGLRSPIVHALLSQWTEDQSMHEALLSWMENVIEGADPSIIPPLKMSSLDHQVRDGFAMHILPLLLRRSDVRLEVTTRAHRQTSYDIAVSVKSSKSLRDGTVSFGTISNKDHNVNTTIGGSKNPTNPSTQMRLSANNAHIMAFRASGGMGTVEDSGERTDSRGRNKTTEVASFLKGRIDVDNSSVTHSSITALMSNQLVSPAHIQRLARNQNEQSSVASVGSTSAGDDFSVGSSITDNSKHKLPHQTGIMAGAINAFGGLISRRKANPTQSSPRQTTSLEDENWNVSPASRVGEYSSKQYSPGFLSTPSEGRLSKSQRYANTLPTIPSSPRPGNHDLSNSLFSVDQEEEPQPYHRVVSAPPGRIGVTFVQYRGHAMVSDVYDDSPLQGWVFPSDILIAIDEVPVSGMRVREIVKLLTARKERQRALRVISNHAMAELTQSPSLMMDN